MHMTNESKPLVLVTGGTGKQGGAAVAAVLAANKTRVRVLTRDPTSPKAQRLARLGVELASGDLDDAAAVEAALQGVSAAFLVQTIEGKGGVEAEERHGIAFAEAVKVAGGIHLVYSSVDGAERASGVPHFESKWRIEEHIARLGLPATILRPVAFMENFATSGFSLAMFFGMMKSTMGTTRKLQLVAVRDIGWFAARALESPESYEDRKIAIAGDELSLAEILAVYKRVFGKAPAVAPLPSFAPRLMLPKDMYLMLRWFAAAGYKGDIAAVRREHQEALSFEAWLRRSPTPVQ
jgi:uncharacterized protein YbjT (DUF2867 family)